MLAGLVRAAGASMVITSESEVMGPILEPLGGLSFLFHNVVLLRYIEVESEMRRALYVLKMRDSDHGKDLVQFEIGEQGPKVLGKLEGFSGVLGGTALWARRA
jgi:circadian clock protein KaiC